MVIRVCSISVNGESPGEHCSEGTQRKGVAGEKVVTPNHLGTMLLSVVPANTGSRDWDKRLKPVEISDGSLNKEQ